MFCHPAWAVGGYSSGPPAARTVGTKSTGGFLNSSVSPCTVKRSHGSQHTELVSYLLLAIVGGCAVEAVDGVGEEDGEAVEVVEEAVDAERGVVVASSIPVLLLELTDVLARRESGEMDICH